MLYNIVSFTRFWSYTVLRSRQIYDSMQFYHQVITVSKQKWTIKRPAAETVPVEYHSEWKLVAVFQFLGNLDFSLSVLVATSSGKHVIIWDASLSLGTLTELGKRIFFQSEKNFPEGILRMLETFVKVFVWLL